MDDPFWLDSFHQKMQDISRRVKKIDVSVTYCSLVPQGTAVNLLLQPCGQMVVHIRLYAAQGIQWLQTFGEQLLDRKSVV